MITDGNEQKLIDVNALCNAMEGKNVCQGWMFLWFGE